MALKPVLPVVRHRFQASGPVGQRFPPSSQKESTWLERNVRRNGGRGINLYIFSLCQKSYNSSFPLIRIEIIKIPHLDLR